MSRVSRRSLLAAPLLAACRRKRAAGFHGTAFAAVEGGIAVVDLLSFTRMPNIALPGQPLDVVVDSDASGKRLFVPLDNPPAVAELDTGNLKVSQHLKLKAPPVRVIFRDGILWCLLADSNSLLPIDAKAMKVGAPRPVGGPVSRFDMDPRGPNCACALADGSVVFIDIRSGKQTARAEARGDLGDIRYRSDGKLLMVARPGQRMLTCLSPETGETIVDLPLAVQPRRFCMTPDGGQLFITGEGSDSVVIVYPYRTEVAQTSLSGRRPSDMALASPPGVLFVSNPDAGSVTAIDIFTQKVVAVTGVGVRPGPIVVTPGGEYALVLNQGSGDMSVIRTAAITPRRGKFAPLFTMIPIGLDPRSAVVISSG